MSSGIQLFTKNGTLYFDTNAQSWSYLGSFIAQPGQSATLSIAGISLMTEVIFQRSLVDNVPGNQEAIIHTAYLSGNTAVAVNGSVRTLITVLGR